MKIRLSKHHFWSFFLLLTPSNIFMLVVGIFFFVHLFSGDSDADYINLSFSFYYFIFLLIMILVFYVIRIKKNPEVLVLTKKEGKILSKKKELYKFSLKDVRVIPNYEMPFLFVFDGQFGETDLTIWLGDGKVLKYKIGINRITFWRLKRFLAKHRGKTV